MADKIYKSPLDQARAEFEAGKISQGQLDDVAIAEFEKNKKRYFKDSDVPAVDSKERLAPGGLVGEFQRAGHYVHDVTDNSFKVNGTPFKIVANDKAGFDVYYGDKKVADDIGNHKDFIALMEKIIKQGGIE